MRAFVPVHKEDLSGVHRGFVKTPAPATPDQIRFAAAVPKTRSGKIMRRLLRDIAAGREEVGDTSTLEDYAVLASLRAEDG